MRLATLDLSVRAEEDHYEQNDVDAQIVGQSDGESRCRAENGYPKNRPSHNEPPRSNLTPPPAGFQWTP